MDQRVKLEFQADRIEAVLAVNGVASRVTGGTITPRWCRFQVLPGMGAKVSEIKGLSEELAAALDASRCRVSRRGAAVAIEVLRDDPQPIRLLPLYQQLTGNKNFLAQAGVTRVNEFFQDLLSVPADLRPTTIPPVTAILGLAEDGAPLLIRLPSSDVGHILISGVEGAGKTTLLYSIVVSLALSGDPDEIAFCFLGDIASSLAGPVRGLGFQVTAGLEWFTVVSEALCAVGKHVVVVADDVTGQEPRFPKLARVMGYEKLHFVLAWDGVPSKEVVNLFKARVVGKVASAKDARVAAGRSGTGAERLLGRGDFLAVVEGRVRRFQVAHTSAGEIRDIVTHRISDGGR